MQRISLFWPRSKYRAASGTEKRTVMVLPGRSSQRKPVLSSLRAGSALHPRRAAALRSRKTVSPPCGCLAPGSPSTGQAFPAVRCHCHVRALPPDGPILPAPAMPRPGTFQSNGMVPSAVRLAHAKPTPSHLKFRDHHCGTMRTSPAESASTFARQRVSSPGSNVMAGGVSIVPVEPAPTATAVARPSPAANRTRSTAFVSRIGRPDDAAMRGSVCMVSSPSYEAVPRCSAAHDHRGPLPSGHGLCPYSSGHTRTRGVSSRPEVWSV